jgi:TRAP-type C4-dicarboxylate transport system substrate-binding protein
MEASEGRINIEVYPAMQLGGTAANLYDQVADGVVDIAWTLPGYTPGRFPVSEVFELPFMPASAEATSQAFYEFYETHLQEEFGDVHILTVHVHGPGLFHMRGNQIRALGDLRGRQVRAPTTRMNRTLEVLGASPIGMPVPQVPESLSRGVIEGTVLPWEVTTSLRLAELVDNHSTFEGYPGLYTSTFVFAMNRASYERLPDDLKAVIDANSGMAEAQLVGRVMDEGDQPGLEAAQAQGNPIYTFSAEEKARWQEATQPVVEEWVAQMNGVGLDGEALLQEARDLIAKYAGP